MEKAYDPMRFLELADRLLYDGNYEKDSRARTAVGRFYYAVFLLAWLKLSEKGIHVPESSEVHQVVISKYNENGLSSIGNRLDQLRESRVDADYHMRCSFTTDSCRKNSRLAHYITGLLDQVKEIK